MVSAAMICDDEQSFVRFVLVPPRRLANDGHEPPFSLSGQSVEIKVMLRSHLLTFKHEDVRLISAWGVNGHGQRLEVGGELHLLNVVDFAVALLVRQCERVLV